MHCLLRNANCNKARKQHLSQLVFMCCFFLLSIPFCLSAFIPRSVSLSLCLGPIYYPFCSTVCSIHKQIQLLHFIKPLISLVDCTTAHENTREIKKYATNSPRRIISGNSVLFVRRWVLPLCVSAAFMLCFSMEIINSPACKWEQFTVIQ